MLTEHGCKIAPRTFYAWLSRPPSARALWDTVITEVMAGYYEPDEAGRRKPESLYGAVKMWAHLQRQGITVARCTVERLMRANGWQGVTRRKKVRTTIADPAAARAADLVKRRFRVPAPNMLLVADFTYVRLASGVFVYTAFAIDAYAGRIVGWTCSASKEDRFVRQAIRHAALLRMSQGNPLLGNTIHHSDAGSQGGFNWSSQHLDHGGVVWPSVRTRNRLVGDGSGRLTVRCGLRCAHQGARTRRGRCSVSFGG
ncbi:hypothetical protein JOF57_005069 [Mycolicibacterium lutetiense]|uniref:Transposase n=1 Tax=Mycolicibacterium lutetiense TaxID=1641992 RepID=A0ABS4ZTD7_9MYCO|nr:hypothetical protein [Mycolicibacterium lutetiense]MBP2452426.1 hypothetical protein [Mycolicibacterium lutetiense]MBP2452433.1 hypothetical protein [Mycolicibacterium lutetiense]MBP2454109.1 hypothetical protein [Mycolicibacterium lutetiense]MBP2454557.1 hypothetical protein [Mycolicibacterium lutetiense]